MRNGQGLLCQREFLLLRRNRTLASPHCRAEIIAKAVVLHYDQPITNDKILQKNSSKLTY